MHSLPGRTGNQAATVKDGVFPSPHFEAMSGELTLGVSHTPLTLVQHPLAKGKASVISYKVPKKRSSNSPRKVPTTKRPRLSSTKVKGSSVKSEAGKSCNSKSKHVSEGSGTI